MKLTVRVGTQDRVIKTLFHINDIHIIDVKSSETSW